MKVDDDVPRCDTGCPWCLRSRHEGADHEALYTAILVPTQVRVHVVGYLSVGLSAVLLVNSSDVWPL